MPDGHGTLIQLETEEVSSPSEDADLSPGLHFLIEPASWSRTFKQNLRDLIRPSVPPPLVLSSEPSEFWPSVFVEQTVAWKQFFQSCGYHAAALLIIVALSRISALQPRVVPQSIFQHSAVVYYSASEYLPPLDTRHSQAGRAHTFDPGLSSQLIISLPPEASNHSQTVVAAPHVKLKRDLALPNSVSWTERAAMPIAPPPLIAASQITRLKPQMERSVVAPPPELPDLADRKNDRALQAAIVAPPPSLNVSSNRRIGDMDVAASAVIAPAPQLALPEQRTASAGRSAALQRNGAQIVAPPPELASSPGSRGGGSTLALSLNPAIGAPPAEAGGNRRGEFATNPNGRRGASGSTGNSRTESSAGVGAAGKLENGAGSAAGHSSLPSGLYVGEASSPHAVGNAVNPRLLADALPPRMNPPSRAEVAKLSEPERQVFGDRKVYSMSLNMPNLNSAGGSWIVRFAALKPDFMEGNHAPQEAADLTSPVAIRKVDPAYPLELIRENVQGTVILYGVIRANGSVGNLRVLRSVDERLDRFASDAITKWEFHAATQNGTPVDVEATFWIPFRPAKVRSTF